MVGHIVMSLFVFFPNAITADVKSDSLISTSMALINSVDLEELQDQENQEPIAEHRYQSQGNLHMYKLELHN